MGKVEKVLDSSPFFTSFQNKELTSFHSLYMGSSLIVESLQTRKFKVFDMFQSIAILIHIEIHIVPYPLTGILFKPLGSFNITPELKSFIVFLLSRMTRCFRLIRGWTGTNNLSVRMLSTSGCKPVPRDQKSKKDLLSFFFFPLKETSQSLNNDNNKITFSALTMCQALY